MINISMARLYCRIGYGSSQLPLPLPQLLLQQQ